MISDYWTWSTESGAIGGYVLFALTALAVLAAALVLVGVVLMGIFRVRDARRPDLAAEDREAYAAWKARREG